MFHYDEKKFFHQEMKPECVPPHPRKHYSLPEQVDCTARELRATLERFMQLERTMKEKFEDHMRILTEDNVTFKTVMENAWSDFVSTVRSEINLFETNTDAIVSIFKQAVNARLDEFNEHFAQSFEDYQAHVKTWMDNFENEIRSDVANYEQEMRNIVDGYVSRLNEQDIKINDAIAYMKTNLNVSLENLLYEMKENGALIGVIDSEVMTNVKQHGATGDGITDDTNAFKAAIAECNDTGKPLYIPHGEYLITDALNLNKAIVIEGADETTTKIKASGDFAVFTLANNTSSSDEWEMRDTKIKNLSFVNVGSNYGSGAKGYAIKFGNESVSTLYNVPFVVIENCRIEGFAMGIYLEGYGHHISNVYIAKCLVGMELIHPEQVMLLNNWIEYCDVGFAINNSKRLYGHNCQWYGGAIQQNNKGAIIHNFYEFFINTYSENNGNVDIMFGDSADKTNYDKGVKNATVILNTTSPNPIEVYASTNIKVTIARYSESFDYPHVTVGAYSKFVDVYVLDDGGIPDDTTAILSATGEAAASTRLFINNELVRAGHAVTLPKYSATVNDGAFREDSIEYIDNAYKYVERYKDSGKIVVLSNDSHSKMGVVNAATGGFLVYVSNNPTAEYKTLTANIPVELAGGVKIDGVIYTPVVSDDDGALILVKK